MNIPANAPPAFHLLTKPTGAVCNLDCKYCFFLSKEMLYPGSRFRMADELLEEYIKQYIEAQQVPQVTIAWQGGEPTLMGLDFFRRSIEYVNKYKKPGMTVEHTIQTNGTKLDDEWCEFFHEHKFLVGLSVDGPRELNDAYRVDKGGQGTFDQVMRGLSYLKKHNVEFNILTTVHAANADYPLEVYRFFRDELGAKFIQFIPIVERDNETGFQEGNQVTDRSVKAEQYGKFLIEIFDEWVRRDVGEVFVQMFDVALGAWVGQPGAVCVFAPTCGNALALEHNGDLYACDHFVEPDYLLGNIKEEHMIDLIASDKQRKFGQDKLDTLPQYCLECEVRFACHGGCPKNRFINTPDGNPGLNYLCAGYRAFFNHVDRPMKIMATLLRQNRAPSEITKIIANDQEENLKSAFAIAKRNDPCPCGSGKRYKHCHGRSA
ncbi:MAG: anaerobic sulfatase maturase [Anaerolineales bacterium]|nr:anaerobic sulfatase maturase [Anaerolineales bacterium]